MTDDQQRRLRGLSRRLVQETAEFLELKIREQNSAKSNSSKKSGLEVVFKTVKSSPQQEKKSVFGRVLDAMMKPLDN